MPCKSCLDLLLQLATGMTNREYSGNIHSLGTFGWGEGRQGKHEKCGWGNMKKVSYISNQASLAPNMQQTETLYCVYGFGFFDHFKLQRYIAFYPHTICNVYSCENMFTFIFDNRFKNILSFPTHRFCLTDQRTCKDSIKLQTEIEVACGNVYLE